MAKRKKTIIAGDVIQTAIYPMQYPRDKAHVRAAKSKMSTAARKAMNLKTAKRKLELLIACNFSSSDLFLTLTYDNKHLPEIRKEANNNLRLFIRRLREYRKKNRKLLKYIYVTEDKHGEGRLHHHVIINSTGNDIEIFRQLWEFGQNIDIEFCGTRDCKTLGEYMTKEAAPYKKTVGAQLWTASRNLKKPEVINEIVDDNETVKCPPNAVIIERSEQQNEYGEYIYIMYRILPIPDRKIRPPRKKQNTFN